MYSQVVFPCFYRATGCWFIGTYLEINWMKGMAIAHITITRLYGFQVNGISMYLIVAIMIHAACIIEPPYHMKTIVLSVQIKFWLIAFICIFQFISVLPNIIHSASNTHHTFRNGNIIFFDGERNFKGRRSKIPSHIYSRQNKCIVSCIKFPYFR